MDSCWYQILAVGTLLIVAAAARTTEDRRLIEEEEAYDAARNAKYHFSSDVQDGINDQSQQRQETRDGLNVKGFYSYSDGYERRKVVYEADENGYRIVKEEVEKLTGPVVNNKGIATVDTVLQGHRTNYGVQSVPTEEEEERSVPFRAPKQ